MKHLCAVFEGFDFGRAAFYLILVDLMDAIMDLIQYFVSRSFEAFLLGIALGVGDFDSELFLLFGKFFENRASFFGLPFGYCADG